MRNEPIAIPADPDDPEDFAVSEAGLAKALIARRLRRLRAHLGLSQSGFARAYGIPLATLRQYEIPRHLPPPAVQAYLKVIEADPEAAARAVAA